MFLCRRVFWRLWLICLPLGADLVAHDYWLEPTRSHGERKIGIRLMLGGSLSTGEEKKTQRRRFAAFRLLTPTGEIDLLPNLTEAAKPLVEIAPRTLQGGALFALERTPARITLDHVKFNHYLREEGLVQAILDRSHAKEMGRAGREVYTRFLKLFLPGVNPGRETSDLSLRPVGQRLEIVPASGLAALRPRQKLIVRAVFEGGPLADATIQLIRRPQRGELVRAKAQTDAAGLATFQITGAGLHALRLVHLRRIKGDPTDFRQPEWESFWASLVFPVKSRGSKQER